MVVWLKRLFKNEIAVDILVFFLLGFLSTTWFRGNNLINGGDFGMPFDWIKYFKSMFSTWAEGNSLGSADYRNIASLFPYATFGALMQSLGFPLVFIEKIFFYFWFTGSGLSMYFLCSVLGMKRLGKMAASVFFMLNPFSLIVVWRVSHALIQMPYCFAPLYIGLYIYGLKQKKGLGYIFLFVLIWILTTIPAYAWPAALAIHLIPLFFYFILSLIYLPQERKFILGFTLKLALVFLGLNFYWLFPFIFSISESMAGSQSQFLMNDLDTLKLTSVKISESIRLLGYWALHSGFKGDPYHPYEAYYRSSTIILISWLIPIIAALGFFNKETHKKPLSIFLIVTIIFGLIGMAGPLSPLGGALIGLYKAFPALALLTRFTILFFGIFTYTLFAVLLGYGFLFIFDRGKKILGKFINFPIAVIFILLFVVLVWPFWTGEVTAKKGQVTPGERVKIPDYWWEAKKWFSEQDGFYRIFPLPMSKVYNMPYNWEEGYSGGDPIRWISKNPVLFANMGESYKIPDLIGKIIEEERDYKDAGKLLGLINVKYILYRKDIKWDFIAGHGGWFAHTPKKIERFLGSQKDLKLVKSFGPWDVYEVAQENILPHIYASQKIIGVDGEVQGIGEIEQFIDLSQEKLLFYNDETIKAENIEQGFVWKNPLPLDNNGKNGLSEAVYQFQIKSAGDYEIFLKNDNLWKYYQESKLFSIKIDGNQAENREPSALNNDYFSLGKINFSPGQHTVVVYLPDFVNLVEDYSFENFSSADTSADAFDGKVSLKLTTKDREKYILIPINNFKAEGIYKISLAVKNIKGKSPLLLTWENYLTAAPLSLKGDPQETKNMSLSQINLPANNIWQNFNTFFNTSAHSYLSGIGLVSLPDENNVFAGTENLFDNILIQKVFDNPLFLKKISQESFAKNSPEVTFKKISPVKYEVQVKNAEKPFWLIFSEAYHSKWQLSIPADHLQINGFANGWFVDKTGDFQATIYFKSQAVSDTGIIFSASIFIFLSIFIFSRKSYRILLRETLIRLKSFLDIKQK